MPRTAFSRPASLLRAALALGLLVAPVQAAWAVVKCVSADGRITFQDVGCDVHSTSQPLVKRFGQLSTEEPAPRTLRARPETVAAGRASPPTSALGRPASTPAWR